MRWIISACLALLILGGLPQPGNALEEEDGSAGEPGTDQVWKALKVNFRNLTFWQTQHPQKPFFGNDNPLDLSSDVVETHFRPDFDAQFPHLELTFKPRWDVRWESWESGRQDGETDADEEAYVNEWRVRVEPVDSLFLSYGREDLQWGPAMLLSPSNPFFTSNGKSQPKREVPGGDYARLIWAADQQWTGSLIVNTDEGRKQTLSDFHKTHALKVDYTADQGYGSLILSKRESGDWRVGGFVNWNLSDATLMYVEGSGTEDGVEVLVGGSYTFVEGSILTLEYFHNSFGSRSDDLLTLLSANAWRDFRQLLFRENYLLLQYYKQDYLGRWNGLLRWTAGLDDNSSALLGMAEYNVMDHVQLFANGTVFRGNNDDELSALLDYQVMAGVEFSF